MIKIGIVTFWWSYNNYGQLLQCYALQTFLKRLGFDAFLIRYDPKLDKKEVDFPKSIETRMKHCSMKIHNMARRFGSFRRNYISSTKKRYSYEDLKNNPPKADAYICGSDQIWNSKFIDDINAFILDFGPSSVKRISYAASFGGKILDADYIETVSKALQRFDVVTVRENDGIEKCKTLGRDDAFCVPDPTLLLPVDQYPIKDPKGGNRNKYIFLYLLNTDFDLNAEDVYAFAKAHDLSIVSVDNRRRIRIYPRVFPTISEWLGYIKNAEYVVTNSFHGTVFSILFNKQFIAIPMKGHSSKQNSRLDTLLGKHRIGNRITSDLGMLEENIDYDPINAGIAREREEIAALVSGWQETLFK